MSDVRPHAHSPLHAALTELKGLKSALRQTITVLEKGNRGRVYEASDHIRKNPEVFRRLEDEFRRLVDSGTLSAAEKALREIVNAAKLAYKDCLERALAEAPIRFTDEWPSYWLEDVVRLQVDIVDERIRIDDMWISSLDPAKAVTKSRGILRNLLGRPFEPEGFGRALADAHRRCTEKAGSEAGEYVDIKQIFRVVKQGQGPSYTLRHFAVDLYRLFQTPQFLEGSLRVDLSPARSPTTGLFLPGPAGGHVSGLRIVPVEESR